MKVYSTKYVLIQGIQIIEGVRSTTGGLMVLSDHNVMINYIEPKYIFTEKEDAINHAEQLRENKIKATLKQLDKLEGLRFNDIPDITN